LGVDRPGGVSIGRIQGCRDRVNADSNQSGLLFAISRLFGLPLAAALRGALLLPQSGEFGFVLFGAAATAGLITPYSFACAALQISLSMIATPSWCTAMIG